MRFELRKEVLGKVVVTLENGETSELSYVRRPALYANRCGGCGRHFIMKKWCNDQPAPGELQGTFTEASAAKGNMFFTSVCSFACADKIQRGGWKELPDYEEFVRFGAELVRCIVNITTLVTFEAELVAEWERAKETDPRELLKSTFGETRWIEWKPES